MTDPTSIRLGLEAAARVADDEADAHWKAAQGPLTAAERNAQQAASNACLKVAALVRAIDAASLKESRP